MLKCVTCINVPKFLQLEKCNQHKAFFVDFLCRLRRHLGNDYGDVGVACAHKDTQLKHRRVHTPTLSTHSKYFRGSSHYHESSAPFASDILCRLWMSSSEHRVIYRGPLLPPDWPVDVWLGHWLLEWLKSQFKGIQEVEAGTEEGLWTVWIPDNTHCLCVWKKEREGL